jgi:hypothetical protein
VPSITARCRPFFSQPPCATPRAFYHNAGVWDDSAADAWRVGVVAWLKYCCSCSAQLPAAPHAYAWIQDVHVLHPCCILYCSTTDIACLLAVAAIQTGNIRHTSAAQGHDR